MFRHPHLFYGQFFGTTIVIVTPNAKMNVHKKMFSIRIFSSCIFCTLHTHNAIS